jgi:DNA-binding CsgD family transcriptional regulator
MAKRIDYDAMLALRSEGLTAAQIAERLGCSEDSVHRATRKFGLERRNSGKRPKLSPAQIHRLWVELVPTQEIADRAGISIGTMYAYAKSMHLPKRPKVERKQRSAVDPSPEEIERLKAVLKERHIQERMREDVTNTQSKVSKWRRGIFQPRGVA